MQASRLGRHLSNRVNFPLCLAPMVGLSHRALRQVIREYMPQEAVTLWPTEMLNSWKIPKEDLSQTPETFRFAHETELVPQILGNEEVPIRQSVEKLKHWGASAIDINMGCPVQKALKHNYGVALMGDPDYAADVVKMTVGASDLPVSVKLRAGPLRHGQQDRDGAAEKKTHDDFDFLFRFASGLEKAGASWITLHPRTAEQKRRGRADWSQIFELKKKLHIPIIGNGDIQTAEDVLKMQQQTGCDLVMSGRALAARPWMVWQLAEKLGFEPAAHLEGFRAPQTSKEEAREYGRCLVRLFELLSESHPESLAIRKFRFHIKMTSGWLDFGHDLYSKVHLAKNKEQIFHSLESFFQQELNMAQRTELRE